MAAPHVAGSLAVLWAALPPQTTYTEVINGLLDHVDPAAAFAPLPVTGGR